MKYIKIVNERETKTVFLGDGVKAFAQVLEDTCEYCQGMFLHGVYGKDVCQTGIPCLRRAFRIR